MSSELYFVTLGQIIKEFALEEIYLPDNADQIKITKTDISRPGLPLSGFYERFDCERTQIIGITEHEYIMDQPEKKRKEMFEAFFAASPKCLIYTSSLEVLDEMVQAAKKYGCPILRSHERSSAFMAAYIAYLNIQLAPRITRHGVLVEVYGEGILILGDSGVGKSETAIELVKRGHRLIADDAVEIKKVSAKTLVGSAPEIIRHYVELRGIGIVDVRRIFGMGAVKMTEKIDLVINLEPWKDGKFYERLGMDTEYTEIMGIQVPSITVPVKPGRNLAIILEIAAMNNRQKKMGYNTAVEFNKKLMGINDNEIDR